MTDNNEASFRPVIGIDLGTTNSAAAYIYKGQPELIQNENGDSIIPSVLLINPEGEVVVGEDARASLVAMPERTKAAVKREMGEPDHIGIGGGFYLPEEISAHILETFKETADEIFGEGEKEAVITVPAYFTNDQRQATKRAGELAGFVVERIINEPTAAALAFGFDNKEEDRHLLVYDLGGGTFDVSVVEMMDGILEVKASAGDSHLGGEDFDWLLVDWLAEEFQEMNGVDPRNDIRAKAMLKGEAEKVKIQLSTEDVVDISLPVVTMQKNRPIGLETSITREKFTGMLKPALQKTMEKVQEVLREGGVRKEDVDDVLLVGGSTRIPHVHRLINDFFEKQPRQDVHPDEAVALGAAVQAGLKSGTLSDSGLIVTDVAPFSMGIATLKGTGPDADTPGYYKAIIDRNTVIPVTRTERFYTSMPYQTSVSIEVFQGEEDWVEDNHFLNDFLLDGVPANENSEEIDVTFRYNLNGILEVTAKSVSNGKEMSITVEDDLDRTSEEAFWESIEKVKQAKNDKKKSPVPDYEQQDIFSLLDEEEELSLEELISEAQDLKQRSEEKLEDDLPGKFENPLLNAIKELTEAIDLEDEEKLKEATEKSMDILIDIEFEM